tara:strand:+ start:9578 stop:11437 length:1860 start_codon:yes stop_codon:yes gene_type:complete
MTVKPIIFLTLILLFVSVISHAETPISIKVLAQSEQWLALLHSKPHKDSNDLQSYVDDNTFFLAEDGAINPESELLASIHALRTDTETQCRFPARTKLLLSHIDNLVNDISDVECTKYNAWLKQLNTSSVVLVFAAAQLNSPSSMYGHTFLRFDPENVEQHSTYLSYALNFGATVSDDDTGFFYAAKGLTGGYPGNFAANPYFEKIKEYNRLENRNLWEYKLNLTQDEINTMLAHMWELQGINFDYYFFDENCSFRLLELLDVARPGLRLVDHFPVTTIPLDTVRVIEAAGLVSDVFYRESILTELESQLAQLSQSERALALALSKNETLLTSNQFTALKMDKQQLVVDSAYRYLRYQNTFNGRQKDVTRRSFLLLRHLNKNTVDIAQNVVTPTRPDKGHKTTMWSAGLGERDEQPYFQLQYRASYHDLLDPSAGYYSGMSLNMVNAIIRVYRDDHIKLEKAELLDIVSLSSRNDFFTPWSWKANISIEQQWTAGKNTLVTQGSGGGGVSYQPLKNSHLFLLATARVEFNKKLDDLVSIAPGLQMGFLYHWRNASLLLEAEHYQFIVDQTKRSRVSIQQSWQLATNDSLRFLAAYHKINDNESSDYSYQEIKIEYRHYF